MGELRGGRVVSAAIRSLDLSGCLVPEPASPPACLCHHLGGHEAKGRGLASIGAVVAALKAAVEKLPFAALADALDLAVDAKALIEQAAVGSGRDGFSQVVEWLVKVVEGIAHLQERLTAIQRTTTAAINRLEGHADTRTVASQSNQPVGGRVVAGPSGGELPVQV
ncbi:MAG: hypothetical protein HOY78_08185, partial [Saccharothrix sp.]|nr:hypothetical protein [Saccharothrix sp.]